MYKSLAKGEREVSTGVLCWLVFVGACISVHKCTQTCPAVLSSVSQVLLYPVPVSSAIQFE